MREYSASCHGSNTTKCTSVETQVLKQNMYPATENTNFTAVLNTVFIPLTHKTEENKIKGHN